jgi:hypothetical protein
VTFFITFGAPDPASVLLADLATCWALVFLAVAGLFPPRRPVRRAPVDMAGRRAALAVIKGGWAA